MKSFQTQLDTKSLILTHGDSDGICAGAIAKSAFPDSYVYFTSPVNLLEKLNDLAGLETLIICDIAIDERSCTKLFSRLRELADECRLYYIDHHPLPAQCQAVDWLYHDTGVCASELTFRVFEDHLNQELRRVAIYGAIGDFCDNTPHVKNWLRDWDKRGLYFQAGTLIQALIQAGRNYEFKREVLDSLSKDIIPSGIPGLLELARDAALNEEKLRLPVKENVVALAHSAYIVNTSNSISKAAIYAASYGRKDVGIAAEYREKKGVYDLSIRSRGPTDVNQVLRTLAPKFGGSGGGHPLAAGARIPGNTFENFLYAFDKRIGKLQEK